MKNWCTKSTLALIPFTLAVSSFAASNDYEFVAVEGSSLSTSLNMNATNLESNKNNAKLFGVSLGANYAWEMNDSLVFDLGVGVNLEKGSSNTSRDNNEYEASNSISLKEAKITYRPIQSLSLIGGALKQDYIEAPMLLSSSAFLGLRQEATAEISEIKITIGAQQVIPNNKNTSERLGNVEEGNPVFYNEFVDIRTNKKTANVGVRVQHFAFDKLSNSVASTSHKFGNTPSGVLGNSDFVSSFVGWHTGVDGEVNIDNNISLNSKYNYLLNTAANDGHNKGTLIGVGAKYKSNDQVYGISLESFNVESEAAVAYYNSSSYGHTNKKGQRIGLAFENEVENFNVEGSFSTNKVIDKSNTNQSDERVITIKFGKSYDLF